MVVAFGLCWQVVFGLVISWPGVREWEAGIALMLIGFIVMAVGQYTGGNRQGSGMP
ncbi:hypothetical protein [Streptomyces sp. NPDC056165]|uniref:hypothetical protein n=1 Tax=Streptomyces sp. NPDC056165 TaxID=3345733 RepID=UPI0035DD520B